MNTAQRALVLERLLTDPATRAALLNAQEAATPSHERDQINAAERDVTNLAHAVGTLIGAAESHHDIGETPPWLRLELLTRVTAFVGGTADTCLHNPSPHQLQPVFAAACKPNLVTCGYCQHMLTMPRGSTADATCDACGHICAGPEVDDGIYPGLTRMGLLIFTYGTCGRCRPHLAMGASP